MTRDIWQFLPWEKSTERSGCVQTLTTGGINAEAPPYKPRCHRHDISISHILLSTHQDILKVRAILLESVLSKVSHYIAEINTQLESYQIILWEETLKPNDHLFSIIFLFLIIAAIILDNKTQMADFFLATGLATLTLNILVLALGYGLGQFFKLPRAQAVSIGYEVGMQNGTLGLRDGIPTVMKFGRRCLLSVKPEFCRFL